MQQAAQPMHIFKDSIGFDFLPASRVRNSLLFPTRDLFSKKILTNYLNTDHLS